jgi:hypothetical protein
VRNKQLKEKLEATLMDLRLKDCLLDTKKGNIELRGDKNNSKLVGQKDMSGTYLGFVFLNIFRVPFRPSVRHDLYLRNKYKNRENM